MLPYTVIAIAC